MEVIWAYSPQAKGRVERQNGVLQDRLVKALRLAQSHDLVAANAFLEQEFLPALNRRFQVAARSATDVHRAGARGLAEVLCWEEERVVRKDWTVGWAGRWFQIEREHEPLALVDRPVVVRRLRDGTLQLLSQGRKLRWQELPARPGPAPCPARPAKLRSRVKPAADHPWRGYAPIRSSPRRSGRLNKSSADLFTLDLPRAARAGARPLAARGNRVPLGPRFHLAPRKRR